MDVVSITTVHPKYFNALLLYIFVLYISLYMEFINMKRTKAETLEEKALKAVKDAKGVLSWNLDISFAKLMLPIVKEYYKKSEETFYTYSICIPNFLRKFVDKKENKVTKIIREYYHKKYIQHMEMLIDALEDILMEGNNEWEKKWNIRSFMKIEYDSIPCEWDEKGEPRLFEMKVKKEYEENDITNKNNMPYNIKQTNKCYKWRQKQLNWFIKNIAKLWW